MKSTQNYEYYLDVVRKQVKDGAFGSNFYNSNLGQALFFQWENRDRTDAFDPVTHRWLRLLFYCNFHNIFLKYLEVFRKSDHTIYADIAATFWENDGNALPKSIGQHDAIRISIKEFQTQLKYITDAVKTWDSFQALMSHTAPTKPPLSARRHKGIKSGGGSGSG